MKEALEPQGHGERFCGAKKHQGGGTCAKSAGWGTDHPGYGPCKLHGGSTTTVSRGAARQRIEAEARVLFTKSLPDAAPVENPLEAYAAFAGRVMQWMQLMDSLLDGLSSPRYEGATAEQVRGEILLYERSMDRANVVLSAYAKLNIDERMARVTERQAEQLIDAVDAMLTHLGLSGERAAEARQVVARHLRSAS